MRRWKKVPTDCKTGRPNPYDELYWCDGCKFGSIAPVPSASEIAEFYRIEQYYTHGRSHFEVGEQETFWDRLRGHIAWRLDHGSPMSSGYIHDQLRGRPSTICDLGCGSGDLALELIELGHRVTGVEVDPDALADRHESLEVFAGTAELLPAGLQGREFDVVVMSHVLEHCRDPRAALENARGLLGKAGMLICEVPNNAAAALEQIGCAWEMFDVPRHLHFFTPHSLRRAVERTGFRVESTTFAHYTRQFQKQWIDTERKLWRNLIEAEPTPDPPPVRNSASLAWRLLLKTAAAPDERRYDSVGVVAVPW